MSVGGWVEVPDRDDGSFHLIDAGVPHEGAIALGIGRSASISEMFRTTSLANLVETVTDLHRQDGGPSIFPKPNTKGKEFSVEEIYSYYGIRVHIQARQYRWQEKVKQPGEWYGLHHALSGQVMIHHYSTHRNVLRKTLLTNVLVCNKSEKQSRFRSLDGLSTYPASLYAMNSIVRLKIVHIRLGDLNGSTISMICSWQVCCWYSQYLAPSQVSTTMKGKQWRMPLVLISCSWTLYNKEWCKHVTDVGLVGKHSG